MISSFFLTKGYNLNYEDPAFKKYPLTISRPQGKNSLWMLFSYQVSLIPHYVFVYF